MSAGKVPADSLHDVGTHELLAQRILDPVHFGGQEVVNLLAFVYSMGR
jgi:hypothetical protein